MKATRCIFARCSADKHVAGPRAGVFVGRPDLVDAIGSRIYELGVERIAASVENAISKLAETVDDIDTAREKLLG